MNIHHVIIIRNHHQYLLIYVSHLNFFFFLLFMTLVIFYHDRITFSDMQHEKNFTWSLSEIFLNTCYCFNNKNAKWYLTICNTTYSHLIILTHYNNTLYILTTVFHLVILTILLSILWFVYQQCGISQPFKTSSLS